MKKTLFNIVGFLMNGSYCGLYLFLSWPDTIKQVFPSYGTDKHNGCLYNPYQRALTVSVYACL